MGLIMLGFEVDKPSKILIKISNTIEYIESDIQNYEDYSKSPYISLVNNSIYLITPYWLTIINYLYQQIY